MPAPIFLAFREFAANHPHPRRCSVKLLRGWSRDEGSEPNYPANPPFRWRVRILPRRYYSRGGGYGICGILGVVLIVVLIVWLLRGGGYVGF